MTSNMHLIDSHCGNTSDKLFVNFVPFCKVLTSCEQKFGKSNRRSLSSQSS